MKQMLFVGIAFYTLLNPAPILSGLSLSFDITYECDTWNEFGVLTVKQFEINPQRPAKFFLHLFTTKAYDLNK